MECCHVLTLCRPFPLQIKETTEYFKVMMKGRCEGNEGGNEEVMVMKNIPINQSLC